MSINIYESEKLKEKIYHRKSHNGLNVYYMPKKGYKKQHAIMTVDVGSNTTIFKPDGYQHYEVLPKGVAHFLEHKMFESLDGDMFDKFSKLGIDSNAYTGFEETSYLFTSTSNFYKGLEYLLHLVQRPCFDEESVEKEKGIITQEIKMYEDDPYSQGFNNLLRSLYRNHPVKDDIAGTVDSVNQTTMTDLFQLHEAFYRVESSVLFIIGDLNFDEIMDTVNKHEHERRPLTSQIIIGKFKDVEDEKIRKNKTVEYMNIQTPLCYIGFKDNYIPYNGKDRVKRELALDLVLETIFGSSSDFYSNHYNNGLIDLSFSSSHSSGKDYGYSIIFGQTEDPDKLYEEIKSYIKKPKDEIFKEKDFKRIKNKNIGQHIMSFNSIENIAGMFTSYYFEDVSILEVHEILEDIDYNYALKLINEVLLVKNSATSIVYPIEYKEC